MLPDSMNVGVIAENIKKLEVMVQEAGSELPTPEAGDVGKILKVGSDGYKLATEYSYTPPAYSDTAEVNTGQKWIDGKDIYVIVFTGTLPEITTTISPLLANISDITPIKFEVMLTSQTISYQPANTVSYNYSNGNVSLLNVVAAYSEYNYSLVVYYYKITQTKKKTSKKGE